MESRNGIGLYPPLSPKELGGLIVVPRDNEPFEHWTWYGQIRENDRATKWPFLYRVKDQREILLYAQRKYIKTAFSDYDPARADMWEQHNRPWDFDHILAKAKIDYRQDVPNKKALKEWIHSVANLRACPMEENRSDQTDSPKKKLNDQQKCDDSFINEEELNAFHEGAENIEDRDKSLAFTGEARNRLIRIYEEWYKILEIGVLTGETTSATGTETAAVAREATIEAMADAPS